MARSQRRRFVSAMSRLGVAFLSLTFLTMSAVQSAQAQTYTVLHNFTGGADGGTPTSTLVMDGAGNLYGTTYNGGNTGSSCDHSCGTVFKMKPSGQGWVLTPLYQFTGGSDGANPEAGVTFGPNGSLYGTTLQGGTPCSSGSVYGCGTVFNLRPQAHACSSALCPWMETVLYRFAGGSNDGALPLAQVTFDQSGNLYGTTYEGGNYTSNCYYGDDYCGAVFELTPSNGVWTESVPWLFTGGNDGGVPEAGLTLDAAGNLYGTTFEGGVGGGGVVFQLTPYGSGWINNTLYPFSCGNGGSELRSTPIFDPAGNLYATTDYGCYYGWDGTVFELTPTGSGWALTELYVLMGSNSIGPMSGLTSDSAGNLYGTSAASGNTEGGLVYELSPSSNGWIYTPLHQFYGSDGYYPFGGVTLDAQGNLYGTASNGGAYGYGVVWEITP